LIIFSIFSSLNLLFYSVKKRTSRRQHRPLTSHLLFLLFYHLPSFDFFQTVYLLYSLHFEKKQSGGGMNLYQKKVLFHGLIPPLKGRLVIL